MLKSFTNGAKTFAAEQKLENLKTYFSSLKKLKNWNVWTQIKWSKISQPNKYDKECKDSIPKE